VPSLPAPPKVGLFKGLGLTLKTLLTPATTAQYPHVKPDLPPRTRGVIALMDENCTVCMLCARECPDWCIYIDSRKETVPAPGGGGRMRTRNTLERFAIDFALCMYCGICVEVCPFDALFWSPEFEYSTYSIRELTHERDQLRRWMDTVPPPPALEIGAETPGEIETGLDKARKEAEDQISAMLAAQGQSTDGAVADASGDGGTATAVDDEPHVEAQVDQEFYDAQIADGVPERVARAKAKAHYVRTERERIKAERAEG
jgi:NADH-quinone oxidoreductase subunit I